MAIQLTRRGALRALSACGAAPLLLTSPAAAAPPLETAAGYRLEFTHPLDHLVGDLEHTDRGNPRFESDVPYQHWYSHEVKRRWHAWGPRARAYPPLAHLEEAPLSWKRERVIATAARFLGYGYQHHHIPDWDPPAHWPWLHCCVGHNGKGVDCSNLTSFVYNQAFGMRMTSSIRAQAEVHRAIEAGDSASIRTIELPDSLAAREKALRTGDLLYIRGREEGPITHVVIWVGSIGRSESGVPLILDSHGGGVDDDRGRAIPCGIHVRPFRETSWYNRCASHAHRIFHDAP